MNNKDDKKQTDQALLDAYLQTGDNRWLGLLLERYTLLLLGVAMKYLKNREEAEDVVQQVFLKAVSQFSGDNIRNIGGWLYVLTKNQCLQVLRDRRPMVSTDITDSIRDQPVDKEALLHLDHTLEQMEVALEKLNPEQRICITMFYLERKSYQQIMDQTGYNFAQVKSYIQNGKRNLKIMLSQNQDHS